MCKEIKRLTLLSQCTHLSKTDRDAITWAIQLIEPPVVEPEKGFDGFDFSSWPEMPDQKLFNEYVKARKSKHKLIMTQAWVDMASSNMSTLNQNNVSVNRALQIATSNGWQGLKSSWVLNELEKDSNQEVEAEEITMQNVMGRIKKGNITGISQIPSPVRSEIESMVRFGRIKKEAALKALENIGFIL